MEEDDSEKYESVSFLTDSYSELMQQKMMKTRMVYHRGGQVKKSKLYHEEKLKEREQNLTKSSKKMIRVQNDTKNSLTAEVEALKRERPSRRRPSTESTFQSVFSFWEEKDKNKEKKPSPRSFFQKFSPEK